MKRTAALASILLVAVLLFSPLYLVVGRLLVGIIARSVPPVDRPVLVSISDDGTMTVIDGTLRVRAGSLTATLTPGMSWCDGVAWTEPTAAVTP